MGSTKRADLTSGQSSRAEARRRERIRLDATIRGVIARHAPDLAAGNPGAGLQPSTLEKIIEEISGDGMDSDRKALRTLDRVLRQMQRTTKGEVRLPDPVVSQHRKASPFRPEEMRRVRRLSAAAEAFQDDLAKQRDVSDDLMAAQILFSAIVFGGLLHRTLVTALPTAIERAFVSAGNTYWIDITLNEEDPDHVRRWFPDPVTLYLIARWRKEGRAWPAQRTSGDLLTLLSDHLARASGKHINKTLRAVLRAAIVRTRLLLPGILVDFLQSVGNGQSLPAYAWWRVFANHYLDRPSDPDPIDEEKEDSAEPDAEDHQQDIVRTPHRQDSSEDLDAVKRLKASLKKTNRAFHGVAKARQSIQGLRKQLGERGPMFTALMDWSEWRLGPRARASSVYRYLVSIGTPLIAAGGEVDPEAAPPAVLESVYRDVLRNTGSVTKRNYASGRLRDFHVFLMLNRDVAPVEIEGELTNTRAVGANIISEAEYGRALAEINRVEDERTRAMLRVMLIIAFRAGPRRSELAHARIEDIQAGLAYDSWRPLLWVHAHPDAPLKTYASLRRLPLAHLLIDAEREELMNWVARRLRETSLNRPAQSLLFCERGTDTESLPNARFDFLVDLLRSVCEDDSIVLHSLRHSFLSHLFSRIFAGELKARGIPMVCPWSRSEEEWKTLKKLFRSNELPREGAYLLSALAGHIDPDETMHSYVHFQDWIAGIYLRELAATHSVAFWAGLEGNTPDALMVRHSRDKRRTGVKVVPHLDTPQRLLATLNMPPPPGHPPRQELPPIIDALANPTIRLRQMRLEGVYAAIAVASKPMNETTRQLLTGITTPLYRQLCKAASAFAAAKSASRNEKARRPKALVPKTKRRQPLLSRLPQIEGLGPSIPRPRRERVDAREAFRRALESESVTMAKDLWFLLKRTSHSDPIVRLHRLEEVNRSVELLSSLGIAKRRLALEIKSVPRAPEDPKEWLREVSARTGFPRRDLINSENPIALPRAIKRHTAGVLALHIHSDVSRKPDSTDQPPTLAYGWRVGCFYALCVLRTLEAANASQAREPTKVPPDRTQ